MVPGVKGIGGKLASAIVNDIYSRLSDFLEAKKTDANVDPAQAMFGKDSKTLLKLLNDLLTSPVLGTL